MAYLSSLTALTLALLVTSTPTHATEYQIDAGHSAVIFANQHIGLGYTYGRFNDISGTIHYDPAQPDQASVEVVVQAASVDSHDAKRDAHLRNTDILDAGTYPTITFTGTGFKPTLTAGQYELTGELTLHGVTKELTVQVDKIGAGTHFFTKTPAIGFQTTFSINRNDFGVGTGDVSAALGDTIHLTIALEGIAQ